MRNAPARPRANPNKLYHYTSASGVDGIFRDHAVWASSISYLNDEEEFTYAFKRMAALLETFVAKKTVFAPWLPSLTDYASRSAGIHVGVFSLSEEPDLLSQWRGYAPSGFSIGFSIQRLHDVAAAAGYTLARCIYDRPTQKRLLKGLLIDGAEFYEKLLADEKHRDSALEEAGHRVLVNTVRLAPLLKNPAFEEEREWRLISGIRRADSGEWRIRVGGSQFVPYLELNLGPKDKSPIRDVVVGPRPHMDLALLGLGQLFRSHGITAKARKATTPYRARG